MNIDDGPDLHVRIENILLDVFSNYVLDDEILLRLVKTARRQIERQVESWSNGVYDPYD